MDIPFLKIASGFEKKSFIVNVFFPHQTPFHKPFWYSQFSLEENNILRSNNVLSLQSHSITRTVGVRVSVGKWVDTIIRQNNNNNNNNGVGCCIQVGSKLHSKRRQGEGTTRGT